MHARQSCHISLICFKATTEQTRSANHSRIFHKDLLSLHLTLPNPSALSSTKGSFLANVQKRLNLYQFTKERQVIHLDIKHSIWFYLIQDHKGSPVSSHWRAVRVSSCSLLLLPTVSQSLRAAVKTSVYSSAQLVAAFCLKMGHICWSHKRRLGT